VLNPTVRTRKHEVVSCSVAVSNRPNPLKNVLPKKRSAYERKPSCFHLVHCVRSFCAEPAKPKPARILASGCHRRGFNHQSTPRSKAASVGLIDTATGFRSQLKTGLTSAPRLPQAERGSRSESLSSSGHPSALGASEWLQ
jgi:hypothetical protein